MKYIKEYNEFGSKNGLLLKRDNKPFWIGSVNLIDGYIEEVHTYEEAAEHDFHHSFYFSLEQQRLLSDGSPSELRPPTCMLFWFNGKIDGNETIPRNIMEEIEKQIEYL